MSTSLLFLLSLIGGQSSPGPDFDRIVRAHANLRQASLTVRSSSLFGKSTRVVDYELDYRRPDAMRLRVKTPRQADLEASDREFVLVGPLLRGFDRDTGQYVERKSPTRGSLLERAMIATGAIDDSLQPLLEPSILRPLLQKFEPLSGWTRATVGDVVRLSQGTSGSGVLIERDRRTDRLRRIQLSSHAGTVDWRYTYRPYDAIAMLPVPPDAKRVTAFEERTVLTVQYADANAKRITEKAIKAYDQVRHLSMVAAGGQIDVSGSRFSESRAAYAYAYDGQTLWAIDHRSKTVYQVPATARQVRSHLAKVKIPMEPMLGHWASGFNPVRSVLPQGSVLRFVGTIRDQGVACEILEARSPSLRLSLWVRQRDGLISRMMTDNLDSEGKVFQSSERVFSYRSINEPIPGSSFRVTPPPGYTTRSFPK